MKKNNSGGGIIGGFIIIIIGISLLWWNEGRTARQTALLKEAKANYVQLDSPKVDANNEKKLVALNGKLDLSNSAELVDSEFEVRASSAKLVRDVEMYQWVEDCVREDDADYDEEKEKEKTTNEIECTYNKEWRSDLIDSSSFSKSGYSNPITKPYENLNFYADNVKVGDYNLPRELIEKLSAKEPVRGLSNELAEKKQLKIGSTGDYYTNTKDEANPQIGDVRVRFYKNNATDVSILAVQAGDTFRAYTSKKGNSLMVIREGNYTGAQIIQSLVKSNNVFKWIWRLLGFILVMSGIASLFSLLTSLTSRIPVLGNIVGGAVGLVSFVLGLVISFVVCAIAWFRFRPIISICLLVGAAILFVILKFVIKKKES